MKMAGLSRQQMVFFAIDGFKTNKARNPQVIFCGSRALSDFKYWCYFWILIAVTPAFGEFVSSIV